MEAEVRLERGDGGGGVAVFRRGTLVSVGQSATALFVVGGAPDWHPLLRFESEPPVLCFEPMMSVQVHLDGRRFGGADLLATGRAELDGEQARVALPAGSRAIVAFPGGRVSVAVRAASSATIWSIQLSDHAACGHCGHALGEVIDGGGALVPCASCGDLNRLDSSAQDASEMKTDVAGPTIPPPAQKVGLGPRRGGLGARRRSGAASEPEHAPTGSPRSGPGEAVPSAAPHDREPPPDDAPPPRSAGLPTFDAIEVKVAMAAAREAGLVMPKGASKPGRPAELPTFDALQVDKVGNLPTFDSIQVQRAGELPIQDGIQASAASPAAPGEKPSGDLPTFDAIAVGKAGNLPTFDAIEVGAALKAAAEAGLAMPGAASRAPAAAAPPAPSAPASALEPASAASPARPGPSALAGARRPGAVASSDRSAGLAPGRPRRGAASPTPIAPSALGGIDELEDTADAPSPVEDLDATAVDDAHEPPETDAEEETVRQPARPDDVDSPYAPDEPPPGTLLRPGMLDEPSIVTGGGSVVPDGIRVGDRARRSDLPEQGKTLAAPRNMRDLIGHQAPPTTGSVPTVADDVHREPDTFEPPPGMVVQMTGAMPASRRTEEIKLPSELSPVDEPAGRRPGHRRPPVLKTAPKETEVLRARSASNPAPEPGPTISMAVQPRETLESGGEVPAEPPPVRRGVRSGAQLEPPPASSNPRSASSQRSGASTQAATRRQPSPAPSPAPPSPKPGSRRPRPPAPEPDTEEFDSDDDFLMGRSDGGIGSGSSGTGMIVLGLLFGLAGLALLVYAALR